MNVSKTAMWGIGGIVVLLIMVYMTATLVTGVVDTSANSVCPGAGASPLSGSTAINATARVTIELKFGTPLVTYTVGQLCTTAGDAATINGLTAGSTLSAGNAAKVSLSSKPPGALHGQTGILGLAKTILDFVPVLYVTALIGIPSGIGFILYKKFGGGRKGM